MTSNDLHTLYLCGEIIYVDEEKHFQVTNLLCELTSPFTSLGASAMVLRLRILL